MSSYISKCYDANECKQFISRLFLKCINAPELTDLDSILYARHMLQIWNSKYLQQIKNELINY